MQSKASARENGKVYLSLSQKNEQQMDFVLLFKCLFPLWIVFILCYSYENISGLKEGTEKWGNLFKFVKKIFKNKKKLFRSFLNLQINQRAESWSKVGKIRKTNKVSKFWSNKFFEFSIENFHSSFLPRNPLFFSLYALAQR